MLGKIRLAERQGRLSQRRMNRVQVDAASVLILQAEIERAEAEVDRMILDLGLQVDQRDDEPEVDEPTTWVMPKDFSPGDALAVLRQLGDGGSMSLDDLNMAGTDG